MPGDVVYFNKIPDDEKFMLQIQFFDEGSADRTNPDTGWEDWLNVELCDEDGNAVIDTAGVDVMSDIASRWLNAWNGSNSVQTIEIDTSLFALNCWSLKFKTSGGQEICTHDFQRATLLDDLISIEGVYGNSVDCHNNWYGVPTAFHGSGAFAYSNKVWVRAKLRYDGGNPETTTFGNRVTSVDSDDIYTLNSGEKMPPYMIRHIKGSVFSGQTVLIGGEEYEYENPKFKRERGSQMFKFDLEVKKDCDVMHGCE